MNKVWLIAIVAVAALVIVPVWMAYAADEGAGNQGKGMHQRHPTTLTDQQAKALEAPTAALKTAISTFQAAATEALGGDAAKGRAYTMQALMKTFRDLNPPPAKAAEKPAGEGK